MLVLVPVCAVGSGQQAWRKSLPHSVTIAYGLFLNICAFNDWMFCHKSGTKLHWLAWDAILESLNIFFRGISLRSLIKEADGILIRV